MKRFVSAILAMLLFWSCKDQGKQIPFDERVKASIKQNLLSTVKFSDAKIDSLGILSIDTLDEHGADGRRFRVFYFLSITHVPTGYPIRPDTISVLLNENLQVIKEF